jgi:hypothetical protein
VTWNDPENGAGCTGFVRHHFLVYPCSGIEQRDPDVGELEFTLFLGYQSSTDKLLQARVNPMSGKVGVTGDILERAGLYQAE